MALTLRTLKAQYVRNCVRVKMGSRWRLLTVADALLLYEDLGAALLEVRIDNAPPTEPGTLAHAGTERPDPYIEIDGEVTGRETIG